MPTVTTILRGGLGNCLFGIAATLAYSMKHEWGYCIPDKNYFTTHLASPDVLYSPYLTYCKDEMKDVKGLITVHCEQGYAYEKIPLYDDCDILILDGYFQSWKYFDQYRIRIKSALGIMSVPHEMTDGWCSIHVRRGDYLLLPDHHPVLPPTYLQTAQIKMMNQGVRKFIVCSDDIAWCRNSMPQFNDCQYKFLVGNTALQDLTIASSCEHNIGSNSSFSWWIYYLNRNKDKIGIFPQKDKWFGKELPHNVDDLYMDEWTLI